jgi:hypothetical protein
MKMIDLKDGKANFLEKKYFLKTLIFEALRLEDETKMCKMMRHLRNDYKLGYNNFGEPKLTSEELVLAQILEKQKISAVTAYKWFRLSKAPKSMLDLVTCGKISMNKVGRDYHGVRLKPSPEQEREARSILREIVKVVEVI